VWKLRKFSLTLFLTKFRQSNGFAKEVTKELISRNIFFGEREIMVFPYACVATHAVEITEFNCLQCPDFVAKIPSNQLFTTELYIKSILRKKFV